MKLHRAHRSVLAAVLLAWPLLLGAASAQTGVIKFVVGLAAGGAVDAKKHKLVISNAFAKRYGVTGANGAGKSTLMMSIFGNPRAREGTIAFDGQDITQLASHEIAKLRIAQSPEGRRIFRA